MTSTSAVRSFAITLAIAITIVGPRASGFTIHRTTSTSTTPSTDLSSDESLRLEVRDDRRPNDIKNKNEDSKKPTKNNETYTAIDKTSKMPEVKPEQKLNITLTTAAVSSTTENVRIPTISSDTVEVFDSVEDMNFYNKTENITNNRKESIELKESELKLTEKSAENDQTEAPIKLLTTGDHNVTNLDKTEEYLTQKSVASPSLAKEITTPVDFVTEIPIITETSDVLSEKAKEEITTDLPQTISNVSLFSIDEISTVSGNVSETDEAQTTTDSIHLKIAEPFLGKYTNYTTIIRKGTTVSDEITVPSISENDDMNAETSNTQVNFENAFNITPIPSLEKLRIDLLSNINTFSINDEVPTGSEQVTREVELSTPYTVESTEPRKQEKVETKRAGFLDNSEKATTAKQASVNEEIKEKVIQNGTVGGSLVTETSPDFKKVSGSESQSQLVEDELQEEFLKEEVLNNHNENAVRYHNDQTEVKAVSFEKPAVPGANSSEESLSVQPLARSRSSLYSLASYKPRKKIDVQPARTLLRDPDDNSWRNESISSLGIVFKPKISSKSFKEILKNKTQAELKSLMEQTKDDVPDLRVRLEKIAEGRKKKKMNKFGEVVYGDYEENSAETRTLKPEPPLALNSAEEDKMLTPLILQPGIPTEAKLDITTPMTTSKAMDAGKEKPTNTLDLFSRLGLDPLTTLKPKKYFNMAEYYDTTDEYDADYVTMMKLDLKKFTPAPSGRPAPPARPREPRPPERRPTVQYFPPREPPPVNLNNVDTDFERKINLFTFKDYPRIEPRPPFVTVPPLPVATARPEPAARPLLPLRPGGAAGAVYSPGNSYRNYITSAPTTEPAGYSAAGGKLDRGSYVIKHYKDFLNAAVAADSPPCLTTAPPRVAFDLEPDRYTFKPKDVEDYYDTRFRKDILNRFVDNFNQNSERFKIDFPILYNSSVLHRKGEVPTAAGSAGSRARAGATRAPGRPCEAAVELSPAYELHYYVPNQEEREEPEPRTAPPYRYGL